MRSLITILFLAGAILSAQSQTFVKQDAAGNNDGTSWEDAYTDLQGALEQSLAGDQLWIAAGTYTPNGPTPDSSHFVVDEAVEVYGGFSGTESALEDRDWEANLTILSGDINGDDTPGDTSLRSDNAIHLVMIDSLSGIPILDGLILQSGTTRMDEYVEGDFSPWQGGAMVIRSEVTLRNCTFRDNNGYVSAAMQVSMADSTSTELLIENCHFEANSSLGASIRIDNLGNPVFKNCTFRNNTSQSIGGLMVLGNSNLIVEDCVFDTNTTTSWGGVIAIFQNTFTNVDSPFMHFTRSIFRGNSAGSFGGVIALQNFIPGTEFIIDSCEFTNNSSLSSFAGAISVRNAPSSYGTEPPDVLARISHSVFNGNSARNGGGIHFFNSNITNKLEIDMDSCSFRNNVGNNYGGAIVSNRSVGSILSTEFANNIGLNSSGAIDTGADSLLIENCQFSGNFTDGSYTDFEGGGAILAWNESKVNVKNSTFTNNESLMEGAAAFITDGAVVRFENVLINNHKGNSTILNKANLTLQNVTMIDNELGLSQQEQAYVEIQNTIFNNEFFNYIGNSSQTVESKGGNISNDNSMIDLLNGYGEYEDLHETTARLDTNFVPMEDSPCVDKGNPEGMSSDYDLAGEDRVQGNRIDIGAYESPFLSAIRDIAWDAPELNVFPNPVQQSLQFQIDDDWTGELNVSIYDLLGREVYGSKQSKTSGLQLFQENISHLSTGEYVLLVSNKDDTYASKIIVQN